MKKYALAAVVALITVGPVSYVSAAEDLQCRQYNLTCERLCLQLPAASQEECFRMCDEDYYRCSLLQQLMNQAHALIKRPQSYN